MRNGNNNNNSKRVIACSTTSFVVLLCGLCILSLPHHVFSKFRFTHLRRSLEFPFSSQWARVFSPVCFRSVFHRTSHQQHRVLLYHGWASAYMDCTGRVDVCYTANQKITWIASYANSSHRMSSIGYDSRHSYHIELRQRHHRTVGSHTTQSCANFHDWICSATFFA